MYNVQNYKQSTTNESVHVYLHNRSMAIIRSTCVISYFVLSGTGTWYQYVWYVEACPLTKLADDGLLQLHSADDAAIKWLEDTAMKALVK